MPANPEIAAPDSYLGKHDRGVDQSRRVLLPADWRAEGCPADFMVLLWPMQAPGHLLVLPPKRWKAMLENLGNASLTDESTAALERFISANSYRKSVDGYGRLPLPDEAATVGIDGEAVLVGRLDKFEVWSPERWRANTENPRTRKLLAKLGKVHL
jgi:division/cell wall cluster transcriptional repressor MraZ